MVKVIYDEEKDETRVEGQERPSEERGGEIVETKTRLKVIKLYAGLPVFTATPTYTGFEGEMLWVADGTDYLLYAYISGGWRKIATTDLTDGGASTGHTHAAYINKDGSVAFTGTGDGFKDEDDMSSNAADAAASQQSVKAYVDSNKGYSSRARAYQNASQDISANSDTKVVLDTENYDGGSEFDSTTNYRFTATASGYYLVAVQVCISSLDDAERLQVFIKKDGTEVSRNAAWCSKADSYVRVTLTDIVYVAASSYIEMYVRHNSGEGTKGLTTGSSNTYMAIHRLS